MVGWFRDQGKRGFASAKKKCTVALCAQLHLGEGRGAFWGPKSSLYNTLLQCVAKQQYSIESLYEYTTVHNLCTIVGYKISEHNWHMACLGQNQIFLLSVHYFFQG